MPSRASKYTLAAAVWQPLLDLIESTAAHRARHLEELGLTSNDGRALRTLARAEQGRSMRSLAHEWRCDASTATWIVDRLERKGLARRRADSKDRRARIVTLTARGTQVRRSLQDLMQVPPPELLALNRTQLASLSRAVASLSRRDGA